MEPLDAAASSAPLEKEEAKFNFAGLPYDIRFKILREYIPFSVKVMLFNTDFSEDLSSVYCWPRGADGSFFKLLPTLKALVPGVYVRRDERLPGHVYLVRMKDTEKRRKMKKREKRISFVSYMLFPPDPTYCTDFQISGYLNPVVDSSCTKPMNKVIGFLNSFLEHHVLAENDPNLKAYDHPEYSFLLNKTYKKILTDKGTVFSKDWKTHQYKLYKKGDECCFHVSTFPNTDELSIFYKEKKYNLHPKPLDHFISKPKRRDTIPPLKICKFTMDIAETVTMKIKLHRETTYYNFYRENIKCVSDWFRDYVAEEIRKEKRIRETSEWIMQLRAIGML